MKRLVYTLLLCALVFVGGVPAYAAPSDEVFDWHGHTLVLDRITMDYSEVKEVADDVPSPQYEVYVLTVLKTRDGSVIAPELLRDFGNDFVLTAGSERPERAIRSVPLSDGSSFGLVFSSWAIWAEVSDFTLALQPLPQESIPADAKIINWSGTVYAVVSLVSDRESVQEHEWPENGYLAKLKLARVVGTQPPATEKQVAERTDDIVLTDGSEVYRSFTSTWNDNRSWDLVYRVEGDTVPALDALRVEVRPPGALWFNKGVRDTSNASQAVFYPAKPQDKVYVMMLSDYSYYGAHSDSDYAYRNADAAFDELSDELPTVADGLNTLFSGKGFTATGDPDSASVIISVHAAYPSAGEYGINGQLTAYNCEVILTAYDARTDEVIAKLSYGAYYGDSISVSYGTTRVQKRLPSPVSADDADKAEFIQALADFWQ